MFITNPSKIVVSLSIIRDLGGPSVPLASGLRLRFPADDLRAAKVARRREQIIRQPPIRTTLWTSVQGRSNPTARRTLVW